METAKTTTKNPPEKQMCGAEQFHKENTFLNALAVQKETDRVIFSFRIFFILIKLISQQLCNKYTPKMVIVFGSCLTAAMSQHANEENIKIRMNFKM